jgi:drug/metabolite transporter (DMT)-like permease
VCCAVRLFTVVLVSQSDDGARRLQVPAVLAVGGIALAVPVELPASQAGMGWLIALVVGAGVLAAAGIRLHRLMRKSSLLWIAAAGSAAAGLVAGIAWRVIEPAPVMWDTRSIMAELGLGLLIDGPLLLLTMWLLRALRPIAFSARFVLVPLVTILGGLVVMRPRIGWFGWVGLATSALSALVLAIEGAKGEQNSTPG